MKISYNWLKELVPGLEASPQDVVKLLTMHSFETEVGNSICIDPGIIATKIVNIEPHPNADRIRLATITDGKQEIIVVCGAHNITAGDIVPYSPPGSYLVDDEGKRFRVKKVSVRGVVSPGMLNSLHELGLYPDRSGIWILPEDIPIGSSLSQYVPDDTIIEADITPNRAHDCMSHIGIAREVAALLDLEVRGPKLVELPEPVEDVDGWSVVVDEARLCPRYTGVVLGGLTSKPSPLPIQVKLLAVGGKPISNLVDITNYVLFEYGNPTHLFDQKKMPGKRVGVRAAKPGERIKTLDGTVHDLHTKDIVITADDMPVALAGIMGGHESEIGDDTTKAFLEVANFNAYSIQETSRRLNAITESSARFGKGIDTNLVRVAAQRAVGLLIEHAGGKIRGVIDRYPRPSSRRTIVLHPDRISSVVGEKVPKKKVKDAFGRLRFDVDDSGVSWSVTVPTDRMDVQAEHDLVEEAVRMIGLDRIKSALVMGAKPQSLPAEVYWREVLQDALVEIGMTEAYNYSFELKRYAEIAGTDKEEEHLILDNSPSPEQSNLRTSLLPGLLSNLAKNRDAFLRGIGTKETSLFEVGAVYRYGVGDRVPGVVEQVHVGGVVVGETPGIAAIQQAIASAVDVEVTSLASYGVFTVLGARIQQQLKYRSPILYFELNLSELLIHAPDPPHTVVSLNELKEKKKKVISYQPFSRFPSVYRDISILVDPDVSVDQVQELIERVGGELVVETDLFDEYVPAEDQRKGLAFHIEYQSKDRTLTEEEVEGIHRKIAKALECDLYAQIR